MLFADLLGKYVLVMDRNYPQAGALGSALRSQGSEVVGPFDDLREGFKALDEAHIDAAVLGINLDALRVFSFADRLVERGIPFIFTSRRGRDLPSRFLGCLCVSNQVAEDDILVALAVSITSSREVVASSTPLAAGISGPAARSGDRGGIRHD
ncbi:hypothetical protein AS026_12790 [Rhizobium altiplani]|uniref:Response regulatory domain-containing protein n=1 Tax=Rhizobium altiplani TaxID=1864509 RepID=A0A109JFG0_9HYPH|nr:hypothetical protein [Rhizobium altiplani]KWV47943.1 hypothetical protein AS026_12790 [Rhizobium altiplani]